MGDPRKGLAKGRVLKMIAERKALIVSVLAICAGASRIAAAGTASCSLDSSTQVVTCTLSSSASSIDLTAVMSAAQALNPRIDANSPIVITAFGDAATHAMAHDLGASYTLDKPFALSDLRVTVYAALELVDSGQSLGA